MFPGLALIVKVYLLCYPAAEQFKSVIGSNMQRCSSCWYKNALALAYCCALAFVIGYGTATLGADEYHERVEFCKLQVVCLCGLDN